MSSQINVALAGTSGYAAAYLDVLLEALPRRKDIRFVGAVDPFPQRCARIADLAERNIPLLPTLDKLFQHTRVDLLMISTPIHLHPPQTCFALQQGANVLCEKPLAGTIRDAIKMSDVQHSAGGFVAIGFQWSFSHAVQLLKRDIIAGLLGRPKRLKSLVYFPRPLSYFTRNDWAGKIRTAAGAVVLDSPVNNATSHYLHNMFYLLGPTRETSATPTSVRAELYRANGIENYDTAALRCMTDDNVEILFYTTHAVPERIGPVASYEFENAVVEYDPTVSPQFVARFHDGHIRHYGSPNLDRHEKIWQAVDSVRTGAPVACGIEAAMAHTLCVVAAQESSRIHDFPSSIKRSTEFDGDPITCIDGLDNALLDCYRKNTLPAEHGQLLWSIPGVPIEIPKLDLKRPTTRSPRPVPA